MKIIKVLSLICFLTIWIFAQNTARIEGKVIQNSAAIPGFLPNPKETIQNKRVSLMSKVDYKTVAETKTDNDGNFVFENVASGDYWVFVDCSYCWKSSMREEITLNAGQTLKLEIELQRIGIRESVTISADTSQPIEEVSKTVGVIDSQEIKDRNEFSLIDSLRTIPGFRVQQLGGFGKVASIKTRGLRNQDTAVLLDGIRFRDASAITGDASSFLSDFTLTSVERIEILRGSGSSLYGTNAIGGTIDFLTPKPTNGFSGGLFGELGALGLKRFRGNFSAGNDLVGFNFGLSRTVFSKGIDKEDDARNTNFQSRVEYNPFSKTNISARFFFSDAFVRLNSNPDTLGTLPPTNATIINAVPGVNFIFDENDPDNFQKSKFFNGHFVLTQIINKDLVFQGVYSGLKTSRKNEYDTLGVGFQSASTSLFDGMIQTASGLLNWTPAENNKVKIGYEYEWEKFGNEGFSPNPTDAFTTGAKQTGSAFYVQDLLSFFDNKLQLAGAFRAQIFSLKSPGFSATNPPFSNLNLESPPTAYTFDGAGSYFFEKSGTKIRAHIGNGYRVPSLYERFGTFFSPFFGGFVALGDPNLKPEKTIAFDFGAEQNLFSNRARLTATYFYTKLTDTIGFGDVVPDIGTTTRPFGGYLNTKGGIARGGEFSGQFFPTATTNIFASYTFTNSDQRLPQVSGNSNIKTLGIPDHQFTFVFSQSIKRLTLNLDFLATSSYLAPVFSNTTFSTYTYRFKGARKADLTGAYEIPTGKDKLRLRLFASVENLFGHDYYENGFRTAGRTARGGLGVSF